VLPPVRDVYFFLSYARSSPQPDEQMPAAPDFWVRKLFDDLSAALDRQPGRGRSLGGGFYDGLLPAGADVRQARDEALAAAQVFVPLYSPQYFANRWALGERESFAARLLAGGFGTEAADRHTVPVLWTPLPPWDAQPGIGQALAVASDASEVRPMTVTTYEQNGLRVMSRLDAYAGGYAEIVAALAARIAFVAYDDPLPRATEPVRPIGPADRGTRAKLVVSVLAPGEGVGWHPYAGHGHALPVAGHVAETAERLGLPARVVELTDVDRDVAEPVLVLVDGTAESPVVRAGIEALPAWAVPIVLPGPRGAAPVAEIVTVLQAIGLSAIELVRRLDELERVVPMAVFQARNQYLKRLSRNGSPGARMSLRHAAADDEQRGADEER
jgi:hypothetical protein